MSNKEREHVTPADEVRRAAVAAQAAPPAAEVAELREKANLYCPLCGHEWRSHDPEDGECDAHSTEEIGVCKCGRDLAWMQRKIAGLSREALTGWVDHHR